MKKISYKKILLIVLLMVIIVSISTVSFASLVQITPIIGVGGVQIQGIASIIIGIIQVIAMAVAAVILVVLAIKYMTAAPGEKAEVKKGMTIYVIGALILFAGSGILGLIQSFGNDVNNTVKTETKPGTSWFKTIFGIGQ